MDFNWIQLLWRLYLACYVHSTWSATCAPVWCFVRVITNDHWLRAITIPVNIQSSLHARVIRALVSERGHIYLVNEYKDAFCRHRLPCGCAVCTCGAKHIGTLIEMHDVSPTRSTRIRWKYWLCWLAHSASDVLTRSSFCTHSRRCALVISMREWNIYFPYNIRPKIMISFSSSAATNIRGFLASLHIKISQQVVNGCFPSARI